MQMVENIYAICRSLFESYIQIVNLAHNKDFFNNILKNTNNCTYDFKTKADGFINYNELIFKQTKTKNISIRELCEKSPYKNDMELYDIFYRSACQFIHLDIMSAKNYFHGFDPFLEIDASLIAAEIGTTFITLMLEQFQYIEALKPSFRKDIKYLTTNLKDNLLHLYQFISSDEYNRNEFVNSIIKRINE